MTAIHGQRDAIASPANLITDPSLTINEFCRAERMSRQTLYTLWKLGKGPRYHRVGADRRISAAARREWREQLEAEAARS
jgi:hypothetical protein